MTDQQQAELDEAGAIAISHTALLGAMLTMLQEKGLVDRDDVNVMFDDAMRSLEKAEAEAPKVLRRARRVLDATSRNLTRRRP